MECTGDFVSAVFRVMPHANDKARFEKIKKQMQELSDFAEDNPPEVPSFAQAQAQADQRMSLFRRRMATMAATRGGAATLSGPLPGVSGDASVIRSAFGV